MPHHEYLHELDFHGMLLAQISYYIPFLEEYELSFLQNCYDTLVEKWPILQGSVDIRRREINDQMSSKIPGFQPINIEQRDLDDEHLSIARISKQIRTMIDATKQIDSLQSALGKQARDRFSLTYPLTKEVGSPDPWLSLTSWDAIAPDEVAAAAFTAPGKTRFISCEELKVFPMFDLTIPNLKNALCSFKCPCGGYWLHGPLLTQAWDAAHADVAAEISGISDVDAGSGLVDTKC
ncbi:hypothetical protein BP00DRAFT_447841 [Aspergillus indologenus CBS 114.80]|uniref:Uncharacterized protein n=1 Tax=Aspergillus indologenus CBS 114.80 TaxID=1450541 RepID=A0A2V5HZS9_9EURO|nr:hypothetical protein BP00DRAFT_447841 [Aspergillus indologenus CBS 114.80]